MNPQKQRSWISDKKGNLHVERAYKGEWDGCVEGRWRIESESRICSYFSDDVLQTCKYNISPWK